MDTPPDSLNRQASQQSTSSSRSNNSPSSSNRRSSSRKSSKGTRTSATSSPLASGSSSPETVRKDESTDNVDFDTEDGKTNDLPSIQNTDDLEGIKFPGVFQHLSKEEQQELLDAKDTKWLKRTRFEPFQDNPEHGEFPVASLKDESLPKAHQRFNPLAGNFTPPKEYTNSSGELVKKDSALHSTAKSLLPSQPMISASDGYISAPVALLDTLGIELPTTPDGSIPLSLASNILAKAVTELQNRLHLFPRIQPQIKDLNVQIRDINTLNAQIRQAKEAENAQEEGGSTKEIDVTEQKEQLAKIKSRVTMLIEGHSSLSKAINEFASNLREHLALLSGHQDSGDLRISLDILTGADTELSALIWNCKNFVQLEVLEDWQQLPAIDEKFLQNTRKCIHALQTEANHQQILVPAPEKFNQLLQKVSVPYSCLEAARSGWTVGDTEPTNNTMSEMIDTAELAKLTVERIRKANRIYFDKGVWALEHAQKTYSDLTQLMVPLIEAYIQSFPLAPKAIEEYQALTNLHYYCLQFSDALKSNAHTDRASIFKKEMKKHASVLDRLSGKPPK